MMGYKKIILIALLLMGFTISCSAKKDNSKDLPGIAIPIEEMNTAFVIVDEPVIVNSHKNGEHLTLVLRNLSDKTIIFPSNYDLSIFVFQDQVWKSVQNGFLYTGGEKVLPTSDVFPPGLVAIAYPYIPELSAPVTIRIVMIGHYENADNDNVGAYLDIPLLP
jgi:hypothetical protein